MIVKVLGDLLTLLDRFIVCDICDRQYFLFVKSRRSDFYVFLLFFYYDGICQLSPFFHFDLKLRYFPLIFWGDG